MKTLGEAIEFHGVDVDEHLDRDVTIPVLTGLQAQGDVMVVPRPARPAAVTAVPSEGVAVVRGEAGGHTHLLLGEGAVCFEPVEPTAADPLDVGVLTVGEGSVAYLAHPEHAYSGIGPGTYVLRRQRELDTSRPLVQARERLLADRDRAEAERRRALAERPVFRYVAD